MSYDKVNEVDGRVIYDKNILLSIIDMATKEVNGVSSLVPNFGFYLNRLFSRKSNKGIKVSYNNVDININIYLNVMFGNNVSTVAYKVQENIKTTMNTMLNLKVQKVNVFVLGVDFKCSKRNQLKSAA